MFVPIILGSDKTVISVAMGQNEFWPLYMSIGNVSNRVRKAHGNAVVLIAFLCIPKSKYYSLASVNLTHIWLNSGQGTRWKQGVSKFPATDVSLIASRDFFLPRTRHDRAWSSPVFGRPFSTRYIWPWPLHRGLPGASSSHVCRSELVPKVWSVFFFNMYTWRAWKIKVYSSLGTTRWRSATSQKDREINQGICEDIPTSGSLEELWNSWEYSGSYLHFHVQHDAIWLSDL